MGFLKKQTDISPTWAGVDSLATTGAAKETSPYCVYQNPAYLKASKLIIVNIVKGM